MTAESIARRLLRAAASLLAAAAAPAALAAQSPAVQVRDIELRGVHALDSRTIRATILTRESRCSSPFFFIPCALGFRGVRTRAPLDTVLVRLDAARIDSLYNAWGYQEASTAYAIRPVPGGAVVTFSVREGRPTLVRSVTVLGLDSLSPPIRAPNLPLKAGDPYAFPRLQAAEAALANAASERGHAFARIEASANAPPGAYTADVVLQLSPGPVSLFGSTDVHAEPPIREQDVRTRIAWREGETFDPRKVRRTYERLESLPIVQEARVQPLSSPPGDSTVRLAIGVTPTRVGAFQVEGVVSSSTCIGGQAYWSTRYLAGKPRVLTFSAGGSNLLNPQLRGFPCTGGAGGAFAEPDWFVQGELREPVGADTWLLMDAGERRASSPLAYVRTGESGRFAVLRHVAPGVDVTGGIAPDRGNNASDVPFFCAVYGACAGPELSRLTRTTTFLPLEASLAWQPAAHRRARIGPAPGPSWASTPPPRWIYGVRVDGSGTPGGVSSEGYARVTVDGNLARAVGTRGELATRLHAGALAGSRNALPPNLRLFGGGQLGVRGVPVNLLGPKLLVVTDSAAFAAACLAGAGCGDVTVDNDQVYVRATGGTAIAEGAVEARYWASGRIMLAAFVDGGVVSANAPAGAPATVASTESLVTPGVGVQAVTSFGPVRVDVAYNPAGPRTYPLLVQNTATGGYTYLGNVTYQPFGDTGGWTGFRRRLQLQVTMGMPW